MSTIQTDSADGVTTPIAARRRTVADATMRFAPIVMPLLVLVLIGVAWSAYAAHAQGHVFPTISETAKGFWNALISGSDWKATLLSWRSLAVGYGISAVGGVALGLLLGVSRIVDQLIGVYLDIALVVPMIVMMPVVLIAIGVTPTAEIVVIVFFALPYVALPTRNGVRELPQLWFDVLHSLSAPRRKVWLHLLLPGARSGIVHGLRLGLAHALSGLFVVELTLVSIGIGNVILAAKGSFEFGSMIGYIVLLMVQVLVVMTFLQRLAGESARRELQTP